MNFENLLKSIDFFGINFDFRMKNYEKYKTKTGGISFMFYFLSSSIYALLVVNNFLINPSYVRNDFENYTNGLDTHINEDNVFYFALRIPEFYNISIKDFLYYQVRYRITNNSRITSKIKGKDIKIDIPTKICDSSLFEKYNNENMNISSSEVICFDLNENHKIIGNQYTNHTLIDINIYVNKTNYCDYQKSMLKILNKDTFYLNILFPNNIMHDDFIESKSSLDGIFFYLNEKNKILSDVYLKPEIYRLDKSIIFSEPQEKTLMNYYQHFTDSLMDDTYYRAQNKSGNNNFNCQSVEDDPKILRIYIRNSISYKIYVKTRVKLNSLVDKVISIYLNFFVSCRILLSLFNLKKAKINILRNLFQVDFENIKKDKKLVENKNSRATKQFLNDFIKNLKFEICTSSFQASEMKNQERSFPKIDVTNNNYQKHSDFYNERNSHLIQNPQNLINYKIKRKNIRISNSQNVVLNKQHNSSIIDLQDFIKKEDKIFEQSELICEKNFNQKLFLKSEILNKDNSQRSINEEKIIPHLIPQEKENKESRIKSYSVLFLLKKVLLCKWKKLIIINNYFNEAEKLFDEYFNISNYIIKINEVESLKKLFLNENQQCLFYYLSYPCLQTPFDQNEILIKNKSSFAWNQREFDKNIFTEKIKKVYYEGHEKKGCQQLQNMFEEKLK